MLENSPYFLSLPSNNSILILVPHNFMIVDFFLCAHKIDAQKKCAQKNKKFTRMQSQHRKVYWKATQQLIHLDIYLLSLFSLPYDHVEFNSNKFSIAMCTINLNEIYVSTFICVMSTRCTYECMGIKYMTINKFAKRMSLHFSGICRLSNGLRFTADYLK